MDKQIEIKRGEGVMVDLLNQEMNELQAHQKQIEEMAKVLHDGNAHRYADWVEYTNADLTLALKLYNAGCRKIPENAVVLTVKQYENIAAPPSLEETDETFSLPIVFDVIRKETRKETAEKFRDRLKESKTIKAIFQDGWIFSYVEVCKAIDEICKEFTEGR